MIEFDKIAQGYGIPDSSIVKMVTIFIESTKSDLSVLQHAIYLGNFLKIHKTAHKLKSSFGYFDLKLLVLTCQQLELEAYETNKVECQLLINQLMLDLEHVFEQMNKYLSSAPKIS